MADTAEKSGGSLSGHENPAVTQKLLGDSELASGISETPPPPSSVPGWEGDKVLAARVETFEASPNADYTQNSIHSTNANSTSPASPSISGNSGFSRASHKSHRSSVVSVADAFEEVGRLKDEEQEEASRYKNKSKKDGRIRRTAPRGRKSGGSMTHQTMVRLSADHAYSKQVAARLFIHHRESNMYSVKKRDG
jgi:hypothetical protein